MKWRSTKNFDKRLTGLSKDRELILEIKDVIEQLAEGKYTDGLRMHQLKGDLRNYWSVSVHQDLRILYYKQDETIILVDIGTHKEVYEVN